MNLKKCFGWIGNLAIPLALFAAGCGPSAQETPILALKFVPNDLTTYRSMVHKQMTLKFEGKELKNITARSGIDDDKIEMTFSQQIQRIDGKGNAVAKITIKQLKWLRHLAKAGSNPVIDFDSSTQKDQKSALARLIGQSYTLRIAQTGQIVDVIDIEQARVTVKGGGSANRAALQLLDAEAVKQRHSVSTLPISGRNQLRPASSWSSLKTFSFPIIGSKTYERIYTLREIKHAKGIKVAEIDMEAIPSSNPQEQLNANDGSSQFANMFDNPQRSYTGQIQLDLSNGRIKKYFEKFESQWVVIDPSPSTKGTAAIKMGTIQKFSLEMID